MSIETFGIQKDRRLLGIEKVENIQALRGIAVLMVLFFHIGTYEERLFSSLGLLQRYTSVGRAGVDLFFVISGFVMVTITTGRYHHPGGVRTFLLRRMARIYPLYWFYSLVYLPVFLFHPALMNRPEGVGQISILRSFALLPQAVAPLVGQGWTLVHEIYFYIVFSITLSQSERGKWRTLGIWTLIILFGAPLYLSASLSPSASLVLHPMTLEFLGGCTIAGLIQKQFSGQPHTALILGILAFVASSFLPSEWQPLLLYMIPAVLVVYGSTALEIRHHFHFPVWLRFIGDISYSVYLSHMLPISLMRRVFGSLHLTSGASLDVLFICLSTVTAILTGVTSFYCIEKPLLRCSYALTQRFFPPRSPERRQA